MGHAKQWFSYENFHPSVIFRQAMFDYRYISIASGAASRCESSATWWYLVYLDVMESWMSQVWMSRIYIVHLYTWCILVSWSHGWVMESWMSHGVMDESGTSFHVSMTSAICGISRSWRIWASLKAWRWSHGSLVMGVNQWIAIADVIGYMDIDGYIYIYIIIYIYSMNT